MSSASICFFIIDVAKALMPGMPPIQVGMCIAGLPTVATRMPFIFFLCTASRPKKVKNSIASMPSIRAPLAMISPG